MSTSAPAPDPADAYEPEEADEPLPAAGYRTYEVYQRERTGETTNLIKPRQLISDDHLADPYPLLEILREHYPCYRDWVGNRFWITRYDDVSSVFADDANYETRSKLWRYGRAGDDTGRGAWGRNLWDELDIAWASARRIDDGLDRAIDRCLDGLAASASPDLATGLAARLPLELWGEVLGLVGDDLARFSSLYWRAQRGAGWEATARADGEAALDEFAGWMDELLAERASTGAGTDADADDLISAATRLAPEQDLASGQHRNGGPATGADLAVTILEADHETLHGGLANMWFQLLAHPEQLDTVRADRRLVKFAWLETLRHSPPVLSAARFARHEVERFGRLIPEGGLLWCSAAAANRDPRAFTDPDRFLVERTDLCQREPRGQYRADGLPSGIAFGLGKPSVHPAVPKERPRSLYAITRDVAVAASHALLDRFPDVTLALDAEPTLRSLRIGEMHTCWALPIAR